MAKCLLPFILISQTLHASSFSYRIEVNPEKYDLQIKLEFHESVRFSEMRSGFKNHEMLAQLSSSIKKINLSPLFSEKYEQTIRVSSLGISSELVSDCQESSSPQEWSRFCELRTDKGDGGKYMVWKKDKITCLNDNEKKTCEISIQGLSKPISIFGWTFLSHQNFSLRAKVPALQNFSEIWWAINHHEVQKEIIKNNPVVIDLAQGFEKMMKNGLQNLKSSETYVYTTEYKEPADSK